MIKPPKLFSSEGEAGTVGMFDETSEDTG